MAYKFVNRAVGSLDVSIDDSETAIKVRGLANVVFPELQSGDIITGAIYDDKDNFEVIYATANTDNITFSVARGREQTSVRAWNAGNRVAFFPTAATLSQVAAGTDGKETQLRNNNGDLQWRYLGETAWNDLMDVDAEITRQLATALSDRPVLLEGATDPATPSDNIFFVNTTEGALKFRLNGAWVVLANFSAGANDPANYPDDAYFLNTTSRVLKQRRAGAWHTLLTIPSKDAAAAAKKETEVDVIISTENDLTAEQVVSMISSTTEAQVTYGNDYTYENPQGNIVSFNHEVDRVAFTSPPAGAFSVFTYLAVDDAGYFEEVKNVFLSEVNSFLSAKENVISKGVAIDTNGRRRHVWRQEGGQTQATTPVYIPRTSEDERLSRSLVSIVVRSGIAYFVNQGGTELSQGVIAKPTETPVAGESLVFDGTAWNPDKVVLALDAWTSGNNYKEKVVVRHGENNDLYQATTDITNSTTAPPGDAANWRKLSITPSEGDDDSGEAGSITGTKIAATGDLTGTGSFTTQALTLESDIPSGYSIYAQRTLRCPLKRTASNVLGHLVVAKVNGVITSDAFIPQGLQTNRGLFLKPVNNRWLLIENQSGSENFISIKVKSRQNFIPVGTIVEVYQVIAPRSSPSSTPSVSETPRRVTAVPTDLEEGEEFYLEADVDKSDVTISPALGAGSAIDGLDNPAWFRERVFWRDRNLEGYFTLGHILESGLDDNIVLVSDIIVAVRVGFTRLRDISVNGVVRLLTYVAFNAPITTYEGEENVDYYNIAGGGLPSSGDWKNVSFTTTGGITIPANAKVLKGLHIFKDGRIQRNDYEAQRADTKKKLKFLVEETTSSGKEAKSITFTALSGGATNYSIANPFDVDDDIIQIGYESATTGDYAQRWWMSVPTDIADEDTPQYIEVNGTLYSVGYFETRNAKGFYRTLSRITNADRFPTAQKLTLNVNIRLQNGRYLGVENERKSMGVVEGDDIPDLANKPRLVHAFPPNAPVGKRVETAVDITARGYASLIPVAYDDGREVGYTLGPPLTGSLTPSNAAVHGLVSFPAVDGNIGATRNKTFFIVGTLPQGRSVAAVYVNDGRIPVSSTPLGGAQSSFYPLTGVDGTLLSDNHEVHFNLELDNGTNIYPDIVYPKGTILEKTDAGWKVIPEPKSEAEIKTLIEAYTGQASTTDGIPLDKLKFWFGTETEFGDLADVSDETLYFRFRS